MGWMRRAWDTLRGASMSKDLRDELDFHLAMREQRNIDQGIPVEEARRAARVRFGNPVSWVERMREIDLFTLPSSLWQDLRFGMRMILKHPGFTLAAVAALTIGIGLNTVVFTLAKAAFDRGLDAQNPDRMVNLSLIGRSGQYYSYFSYPDYEAYRDDAKSFAGVIAEARENVTLAGAGGAMTQTNSGAGTLAQVVGIPIPQLSTGEKELATVSEVSENYFDVLGEQAIRGRIFSPRNHAELIAHPSTLISENYWEMRFQSNPAVIGRTLKLNGASFTIIGITPRDFTGTGVATPDFWIPLVSMPLLHPGVRTLQDRNAICCRIFARLADGVTMAQAQGEVQSISDRLRTLHDANSDEAKPSSALIWPGSPFARKLDSSIIFSVSLIMLTVALVLVIACANVASLQLARGAARQNELSMRRSLGASRARVVRQLLTESVLLAVTAGVTALLFAWGLLRLLLAEWVRLVPPEWGAPVLHVNPDLKVFAYVLGISLFAGVLFGLAPALESSRSVLGAALKANQNASPARRGKLRNALVATQVAVCLVLMINGALLIRSSMQALVVRYEVKKVLNLELGFLDNAKYTSQRKLALAREIRAKLATLPGVADIAAGRAPAGGGVRTASISTDATSAAAETSHPTLYFTYATPNFFQVVGIPLLAGRGFPPSAGATTPVAVVSQSAARALWRDQNPIGKKLSLSTQGQYHGKDEPVPDGISYEVIGVTADAGGAQLDGSDAAEIYLPLPEDKLYQFAFLIRTYADPQSVRDSFGGVISSVDPEVLAYTITLEEQLHQTAPFAVSRCAAIFASFVGFFGLLLACMGIYGTVSYMVVLRTHEVGIRMALGASRRKVLQLMLQESMRPVVNGIGVGIVLAMGAAYLLRALFYGLGALDLLAFAGMSLLFLAIALLAAFFPSQTATRVDPIIALRYE